MAGMPGSFVVGQFWLPVTSSPLLRKSFQQSAPSKGNISYAADTLDYDACQTPAAPGTRIRQRLEQRQ